jgi:hypothetical protein
MSIGFLPMSQILEIDHIKMIEKKQGQRKIRHLEG